MTTKCFGGIGSVELAKEFADVSMRARSTLADVTLAHSTRVNMSVTAFNNAFAASWDTQEDKFTTNLVNITMDMLMGGASGSATLDAAGITNIPSAGNGDKPISDEYNKLKAEVVAALGAEAEELFDEEQQMADVSFDEAELMSLLNAAHAEATEKSSLQVNNITALLREAHDTNVNGRVSGADPNIVNEAVSQGFKAGDILSFSEGISLEVKVQLLDDGASPANLNAGTVTTYKRTHKHPLAITLV